MAKKTPLVENDILTVRDFEQGGKAIYTLNIADPKDWSYWQEFLKKEKVFRYVWTSDQGLKYSFSCRKDRRPNGWYWYGHKYVKKQLRRRYIGANKNLTAEKLRQVALDISRTT